MSGICLWMTRSARYRAFLPCAVASSFLLVDSLTPPFQKLNCLGDRHTWLGVCLRSIVRVCMTLATPAIPSKVSPLASPRIVNATTNSSAVIVLVPSIADCTAVVRGLLCTDSTKAIPLGASRTPKEASLRHLIDDALCLGCRKVK